ncbi:Uncharacterised protein [Pseudomonas aeruginosa]|nr:Uncharacterised protein [Pseudomonas aeruginosa]
MPSIGPKHETDECLGDSKRLDTLRDKIGKERHRQWHLFLGVLPKYLLHCNDGLGHGDRTPHFVCSGKITTLFQGEFQITQQPATSTWQLYARQHDSDQAMQHIAIGDVSLFVRQHHTQLRWIKSPHQRG